MLTCQACEGSGWSLDCIGYPCDQCEAGLLVELPAGLAKTFPWHRTADGRLDDSPWELWVDIGGDG